MLAKWVCWCLANIIAPVDLVWFGLFKRTQLPKADSREKDRDGLGQLGLLGVVGRFIFSFF